MSQTKLASLGLLIPFMLLGFGVLGCTCPARQEADLVLRHGRILTMNDAQPEASALAVTGERIAAVGSWDDVRPFVGADTRVVDLEGRTVLPGLNESHIHVRDLGFQQNVAVNLEPARSISDVQALLSQRLGELRREEKLGDWLYPTTGETGPWLFGLGWTQDRLAEHRMANRHELDEVARDLPISLARIYRGVAVNTRVFELLGIDFDDPSTYPGWFTEDPADFEAGDVIVRDPASGLPTGVFLGTRAPLLVSPAIPRQSLEQKADSLVAGLHYLASLGITSVVEAGSLLGEVTEVYRTAHEAGRLPIRAIIYDGWYRSHAPGERGSLGDLEAIGERLEALGSSSSGNERLRVRGAKSSMDGGVGARSAAVSVPYLPIPGDPLGERNFGALRESDIDLNFAQLELLARHGWELHTHAIGDVAIRRTVDIYTELMDEIRERDPSADLRWSVIHAYLPDEPGTSVIEEMARYGIIAAVNPANLYFEGDSFVRNIGAERMARHTPYKTLLDSGIRMASGSDYPNNSPDPWIGLYQMVTRRHQISGEVHGSDQRIPLAEALKTFTLNGAYLTYDDDVRGSLEAGKLADLVVLDADLSSASEEDLLEMGSRVLLTLVGGEVVYRKNGSSLAVEP